MGRGGVIHEKINASVPFFPVIIDFSSEDQAGLPPPKWGVNVRTNTVAWMSMNKRVYPGSSVAV
jgi:hypothetical protein